MMLKRTGWLIAILAMPALSGDGIFDEYRDLMGDDNPAIFVIDEGEALWLESQGPLAASLENCDLGMGPGVTEGGLRPVSAFF
jgi:sulfur-oxidizing protein SoxA